MTVAKEQRVPRGRPKVHNFETKQEYFRNYYKLNREKWNYDYLCTTCELYCSFANKTRHAKSKFHLNKLADKGTADKGTADKGTADKGTADKGTADKGTTDEEMADKGTTDEEITEKGNEIKNETIIE